MSFIKIQPIHSTHTSKGKIISTINQFKQPAHSFFAGNTKALIDTCHTDYTHLRKAKPKFPIRGKKS